MRKILTLLVFFITSTISYGQLLTEKNIIGKWSVTKVTSPFDNMNLPGGAMKDIIALKKVFHNSIFEFKENGQFFIKYANENLLKPNFKKLNGKNWKLNLEDEQITIVDKDKGNSEVMFFLIDNTQIPNVKFAITAPKLQLHMKKGIFSTKIDYDK